jgi:hypothetical protein
MGVGGQTFTKNDINKGIEADLPPHSLPGDLYLATDTGKLCICFEAGTWTKQAIPVPEIPPNPFSVDENNILRYNGKPFICYTEDEGSTQSISTTSATFPPAPMNAFNVTLRAPGGGNTWPANAVIASAAPNKSQLNESNIVAAGCFYYNGGSIYKYDLITNKSVAAGTVLYAYYAAMNNPTKDDILNNLNKFNAGIGNSGGSAILYFTAGRPVTLAV